MGLLLLALAAESRAEGGLDPAVVKAQMVLNFPLVTDWPDGHRPAEDRIRYCAFEENDKVTAALTRALSDDPHNHSTLNANVLDNELYACDVLFVSTPTRQRFKTYRVLLESLPVLTIGEGEAFLRDGGMIAFVKKLNQRGVFSKETVGFQVHPGRIQARGLELDPMLLELAEKIVEDVP
jgi:hypothetical protein